MKIKENLEKRYRQETRMRAYEAQRHAHEIAFGPIVFEASRLMAKKGIFDMLEEHSEEGMTLDDITCQSGMSLYAVKVLVEASLTIGTIYRKDDLYFLTKTGWFFNNEESIKVNVDFNHDVNYQGFFDLEKALDEGKPAGLRHFGSWATIYEGLSQLPADAQRSWLAFDHFYSDSSFPDALNIIFEKPVRRLLDVGGNTGKFALQCVGHNADVRVTIMDLPQQLEMMGRNVAGKEGADRIDGHAGNLLDDATPIPCGFDIIWMSQFLDCFSEEQVLSILTRAAKAMDSHTRLYIMETIWDRQRYDTAAYCLTQISLYFTAMANGNSKMFNSADLTRLIEASGLVIDEVKDDLGVGGHSIVICKRK